MRDMIIILGTIDIIILNIVRWPGGGLGTTIAVILRKDENEKQYRT